MTAASAVETPPIPARQTGVKGLRVAAAGCRACPLWRDATQTVFGAGPARASIMLVGEQPGDQEDRAGRPFVGPAGRVLEKALDEAGIDDSKVYVTNAVKHFKWKPKGKRRIHQRPSTLEISACKPWLEAELDRVRPAVVGILGSVAAQSLMGSSFKLTPNRGKPIEAEFGTVVATYHPSSVLRGPPEDRDDAFAALADDLRALRGAR